MKTTVWNTKENRPATSSEVNLLIENNDLYINYYTRGSINIGVVWIELSTIGGYDYHLVIEGGK